MEQIGAYQGAIASVFDDRVLRDWLGQLAAHLARASSSRAHAGARIFALDAPTSSSALPLLIRAGCPVAGFAALGMKASGTSEARAWRAASRLAAHGASTPPPVAWLERWTGVRCVERYFITRRIEPVSNFRDALRHLLWHDPDCGRIMELLELVAPAVRAMHEAGVLHRDLGNQNILLAPDGAGGWRDPMIIDLSRARLVDGPLGPRERGADLGRLYLPTDLLRVFCEMYWAGRVPDAFMRALRLARRRYRIHAWTRSIRHPIRQARVRRDPDRARVYPDPREIWIWDEKSAQPISAWAKRERNRLYPLSNHTHIIGATAAALPAVMHHYRRLRDAAFANRRALDGAWGISVEPRSESWELERAWIPFQPALPVLIRFYHHKGPAQWKFAAHAGRALHNEGFRVSFALCQDRRAVRDPDSWAAMCDAALELVGDFAEWIEMGHAINRVKWGLWSLADYRKIVAPVQRLAAQYPRVNWMGPACIDFEYPQALAALAVLPHTMRFQALSHHLYVDRRGAPENPQGLFAALEKFALARALARASGRCEDRVIVSEVNWPLEGTGVYSPVASPYMYPGQRVGAPNVSEEAYARYMVRYLLQAACSGLIDRVYWWRLAAHGFGLVDEGANPWRDRPAYRAWCRLLEVLGDAVFERNIPTDDGGFMHLFLRSDGERIGVGYAWKPNVLVPREMVFSHAENAVGQMLERAPKLLGEDPIYFRSVGAPEG